MTFLSWPAAALFVCGVALALTVGTAAYWLGYKHGSSKSFAKSLEPPGLAPPVQPSASTHIPSYRVNELVTLLELGVLTPEEFEHEKGKLHAGRSF